MKIEIITVAPVPAKYDAAITADFRKRYDDVLRAETEISVRGLRAGPAPHPENLTDYRNHYYAMLLTHEVVKAVLAAEADGADAVIVNCFDDPGVREARSVARVPVFGICEPSLHFACQLGREFGALVPDLPGQVRYVTGQVREHGLMSRLIENGVRKDGKPYTEAQPEADRDPSTMATRLATQATQLVRDGADVVLVACGGLGEICDRADLHHVDVDERRVPVITPLPVALKHAEMMLDLHRAQGIPIPSQVQDGFRLSADEKARIETGFYGERSID